MERITFKVRLTLTEDMLGTVPKDPEVYKTHIEAQKPEEVMDEEYLTVEKIEEKGWTGFHKDEKGLFIFDYMVKGMLKNAANILKDELGVKALKSKITNYVFVYPRRIYLGKTEPDGILERPVRGDTPKGPRVFLVRSDYVAAGAQLEFDIVLLRHKELTPGLLQELLEYGQFQGLGQWRNGSYGRFSTEIMVATEQPHKKGKA